jgi:glycosyltransferase involved in cell wall biosynthesis
MHSGKKTPRVCLIPKLTGLGGMVSFQAKLAGGLAKRGIEVCYSLKDQPFDAILVIGGTRELMELSKARRAGIRIVHRLDGMNWLHRRTRTGIKHYLRAEYGNFILRTIRSRLADYIVYQSEFSRQWWERECGLTHAGSSVMLNGVDLNVFSPVGPAERPVDHYRILLVEGTLGGGYEVGLETAVQLGQSLLTSGLEFPLEIAVAGRVRAELQEQMVKRSLVPLTFLGQIPHEKIPQLDRSAHLLYSADLNAACPNSVVEALACGLPVVAFDTGALPELVQEDAGRIAHYGGNPWRLDPPDVGALANASEEVLRGQNRFREGARRRAEESLNLDAMVESYLEVLLGRDR